LLYREPTESEVHQHLQLGREDLEYDVYYFTDLMLRSSEREKAAADLNEPQAGSLEGLTFYYRRSDTALGASVAHSGGYETAVARVIERLLERGDTFVDVGANIGLHAIRAARRVGPEGRVICFEPNPWNIELLSLTMAANKFDQVMIRPVAASDEAGEVPLHARRGQSNATVEVGPVRWASDVQVTVPSVRLDDELADLDELALLKIDIEGAEPLAFTGMAQTLKRLKPHIMMEVFPDALRRTSGVEPADFLAHVTSFGYRLLPLIPGSDELAAAHSIESIVALPERYGVTHVDVLAEPC
jgi:FkbM family methyltransferase